MLNERPDSWYHQDENDSPADYGWVRESDIPNINNLKDFFLGVVEAIYVSGDMENLQVCLEEIAGEFNMEIPNGSPVLSNKKPAILSEQLFKLGVDLSRAQNVINQ